MSGTQEIVVEGYAAADRSTLDLRDEVWGFALDQRTFGPRRLVVAFADRSGHLLAIAHTPRLDPPEKALGPCIELVGQGAAAAVALCDEPVDEKVAPPDLALRFVLAQCIAAAYGVFLVDWIACDDHGFRSSRIAIDPDSPWWDLPEEGWNGERPRWHQGGC